MPVVRVIAVPECGHCALVRMRLCEVVRRHREIAIEEVDLRTAEGAALAARHRVWTHPTLIVGGSVVAEGDVDVPDLEAVLGLVAAGVDDATAERRMPS
jgi:hypothetical protein